MSKEKIIEAAIKQFYKGGFFRASMQDIAHEAGVAKGTLYYHFPSKSELFLEVVKKGITETEQKVRERLEESNSIEQNIKDVVDIMITYYSSFPELAGIFFSELSNGIDPPILNEIKTLKDRFLIFLAQLLEEGYGYNQIKHVNFKVASAALIGLLNGVCKYYLENKDAIDLNEVKNLISSFIISGLKAD